MDFSKLFEWITDSLFTIVSSVFSFILKIVFNLINLIIAPIDKYIIQNIPFVGDLVYYVNRLIDYIIVNINWFFSWLGIDNNILLIIVSYISFKIFAPLTVSSVKFAIQWYRSLK